VANELLEVGGGPLGVLAVNDADVVSFLAKPDQRRPLQDVAVLDEGTVDFPEGRLGFR
jgi:hypothetical protein